MDQEELPKKLTWQDLKYRENETWDEIRGRLLRDYQTHLRNAEIMAENLAIVGILDTPCVERVIDDTGPELVHYRGRSLRLEIK